MFLLGVYIKLGCLTVNPKSFTARGLPTSGVSLTIVTMLEWVPESGLAKFEEGSAMIVPAADGHALSIFFGKKQFCCFGFQTVSAARDFCERVLVVLRAS